MICEISVKIEHVLQKMTGELLKICYKNNINKNIAINIMYNLNFFISLYSPAFKKIELQNYFASNNVLFCFQNNSSDVTYD